MEITRKFGSIGKDDVGLAGGKGASLGEMTQAGIPVPPGYVLLAESFDKFVDESGLKAEIDAVLDSVNTEDVNSVEEASEKIQSMIINAKIPSEITDKVVKEFDGLGAKFVAVRSSATAEDSTSAAWAGQLNTYLNTTKKDLLENVQKCWASLFTPRAIVYRFEKNMQQEKVSVAVVVQKMVESEISGIAFSVHPVTQDRNHIIIEAGLGLGEAIVSGQVTPDSYVVDKQDWHIIDINVSEQSKGLYRVGDDGRNEWKNLGSEGSEQFLDESKIVDLGKLIKKIEDHYGFPVDVEWAIEGGKFYITQSRPITTLTGLSEERIVEGKSYSEDSSEKVDESGSGGDDVKKHDLSYYFSWGERHSVISTESWLRGYVNLRDVIANENKNVFMLVKKGSVHTYNASEDLLAANKAGEDILDLKFLDKHLKRTKELRQEFQEHYEKIRKLDLNKVKDKELLDLFLKYQDLFDKTWAYFKLSQPEYLEPAQDRLKDLLKKNKISSKEIEKRFITLTTPTELDLIKEEEIAALKLSFKKNISDKDLIKHAEEFSWLFFNTYDKNVIMDFLHRKFKDLKEIPEKERNKHLDLIVKNLENHKKEYKELIKSFDVEKEEIEYLASVFGRLAIDRLKMKSWWGGAEYLFLPMFEYIGRRAGLSAEDLLMSYSVRDIENLLKEGERLGSVVVENRKKLYAVAIENGNFKFYEANEAQEVFDKNIKPEDIEGDKRNSVTGVSANVGKVKGRAYIVKVEDLKELIKDMDSFQKGDILVTTMTQPTMVSLARKSGGIVTNEGGITSHASILSREFGIPCVVGTQTGTELIKTGDLIEVDGDKGVVRILEKK